MPFEEDFKIIKDLTEIQACSGNEVRIREYIKELVERYCDNVETDVLGNLICFLNGRKTEEETKLKVMLNSHMDEIGLMVRYIDKEGFIKFSQVGGHNPRILPGQIVTIHSSSGEDIVGVIGEKPIHLISQEDRKKPIQIEELFVDAGFKNAEEAKEYVAVGDYIVFKQDCVPFKGNERIFSKSFDDRAGCFVLIKLIVEFSDPELKEKLDKDLIFLFASQEEIGVRGATVGAYKITPDVAITVEVTHAIDYPGLTKEKHFECFLGSGPSIAVGPNLFPKLTKLLIDTAKEQKIPYVLEAEPYPTSTDARAIQMTKSGIPCALVAIPTRYMHSNITTIEYQDMIHTVNLLKSFLLLELGKAIRL